MEKLTVNSITNADATVVTAKGRIDSQTWPMLDAELTKAVGDHRKVVLDLKDVEYMSSAGIRAIVKAAQAAEKSGGMLKLASVPEEVHSVLYTVGLTLKIGTYPTVSEAVTSF